MRLHKVIKDLNLKLPQLYHNGDLAIEICTASLGNLNAQWLDGFVDCALGRKKLDVPEDAEGIEVPQNLTIVYPTMEDVKNASNDSKEVRLL